MQTADKSEVLKRYFGHSAFRKGQAEVIDSILSGRDVLGVMPTGAGKSMCFQIPALMLEGMSVVVSPLISLMKDQVESLRQSGVSAAYINSSLTEYEAEEVFSDIYAGRCKILYAAPERLLTESFLNICRNVQIPLVAVDEAHCVSHWGQDFRPSYLKIAEFVGTLERRPILAAFTATATDIVKRDIVNILGLRDPYSVTTGFDRPNLFFEVRKPRDKDAELLDIVRKSGGGSTIIYCSTRKNTEAVAQFLTMNGCPTAAYHAGLSDNRRQLAQNDFIYDRVNVIAATNAFGMGIDKSDVSLVVHYNMPKDIESYYQEAGRAGRDGSPARCILLYAKKDVMTAQFLIDHSRDDNEELSPDELQKVRERDRERLRQMTFYSTTTKCLRRFILNYFGENAAPSCDNCSNCMTGFETVDVTIEAQKILSCIYRMKQRGRSGGKALVCAVLRGSREERVISNGLDGLSTYGIMKDVSTQRTRDIIDYLEREGYIEIEPEHMTCALTPAADEFIKARRTLLMKLPREEAEEKPVSREKEEPANPALFEELRALRKELAASLGVPAYVVFADASLREMCAKLPVTNAEFMGISGVGSMKTERYGRQFIRVIKKYKQ